MSKVEYDLAEEQADGTVKYFATYWIGGKDEDGEYTIILDDGPAQGERVYL